MHCTTLNNCLQPLLEAELERSALPVSSVINTFCRLHSEDSTEVDQLIKMFEDELRYNCKADTDAQTSRMMKALKAIGNAGNADRVVPTLNRCLLNNDLPIALRVAAISAFRRISCTNSVSISFISCLPVLLSLKPITPVS